MTARGVYEIGFPLDELRAMLEEQFEDESDAVETYDLVMRAAAHLGLTDVARAIEKIQKDEARHMEILDWALTSISRR